MKRILLITCLLVVSVLPCNAYEVVNLDENPKKIFRSLSAMGYGAVELYDFNDWSSQGGFGERATVSLNKTGSSDKEVYFAILTMSDEGKKRIHFLRRCDIEREVVLTHVMRIEKTNVRAAKGCTRDEGNSLVEGFFPLSPKAQSFTAEQFLTKKRVHVTMGSIVIPFPTNGFAEAWERLGDAPL